MPIQNYCDLSSIKDEIALKKEIRSPDILKYWAAVHLVFIRNGKSNSNLKLAMIRRVKNEKDPWSGHYAFPGGAVEKEEGLKEASLRETKEEIGLEVPIDSYLGEFYRLQVRMKGKDSALGISAHASLIELGEDNLENPLLNPCPIEVDEAFWFSLDTLLRKESIVEKEFKFSNELHTLPCIHFDGHTIWGLSYMILREFLLQWGNISDPSKEPLMESYLPIYPYISRK